MIKRMAVILLLAFALRVGFVVFWYQMGQGDRLSSDAESYKNIAENLNKGAGFQMNGAPTARRPPLYPLWIAFFLKYGSFPIGVRLGDALLGALSCFLIYAIGKQLFDEPVGLLSAGIFGVDYLSIRQIVSVLPETFFMFFLLLSFYFLIKAFKINGNNFFFTSGVFAGFSLLTREVLILYFPLVAVWIFLQQPGWKNRFLKSGLFLLGLMIVIGPWMIRNSLLYHRPVMITTTAGHSFYLANNPRASGGKTGGDWEWEKDSYLPKDPGLKLLTPQTDQRLLKEGMEFIRHDPGKFIELMGKKIVNTWRPYQTDSPLLAQWVMGVPYICVMIFGTIGFVSSLKRWREFVPAYLLIAYIFLLHTVLIAEIRYRFPAMPFLMIFAAAALMRLFASFQKAEKQCPA